MKPSPLRERTRRRIQRGQRGGLKSEAEKSPAPDHFVKGSLIIPSA